VVEGQLACRRGAGHSDVSRAKSRRVPCQADLPVVEEQPEGRGCLSSAIEPDAKDESRGLNAVDLRRPSSGQLTLHIRMATPAAERGPIDGPGTVRAHGRQIDVVVDPTEP